MKKVYSLLISVCLAMIIFCQSGLCLSISADVTNVASGNNNNFSLVQLVRLKKRLSGIQTFSASNYNAEMDYNKDGDINAVDIAALRRLILGLPVEPETDEDGYCNQVIKP